MSLDEWKNSRAEAEMRAAGEKIMAEALKRSQMEAKIEDQPLAYEFHNYETGHCYVDYVEREGMTEKDGYTKIPLYKKS